MIGYSYLELCDLIKKSSEANWLAVRVNVEDCDWKLRYLKVVCGVSGLMYRQAGWEQWKNNCYIYRDPFNRRGSSVSLTGAHSNSCYHELQSPSQDQIVNHNYLFPPLFMLWHNAEMSEFLHFMFQVVRFVEPLYKPMGPDATTHCFHPNPHSTLVFFCEK